MTKRDLAIVVCSVAVSCLGVILSLLGYTDFALIAVFLLLLLVILLIMLQRRQLGVLQQRTLKLLRKEVKVSPYEAPVSSPLSEDQAEVAIHIATKKILGVLQAQQNEIQLLSDELRDSRNLLTQRETE